MSELSRCGRVYRTFDEAYRSAEARSFKSVSEWKVLSCAFGEHWHVVAASQVIAKPKPARPVPAPGRQAHRQEGRGAMPGMWL